MYHPSDGIYPVELRRAPGRQPPAQDAAKDEYC